MAGLGFLITLVDLMFRTSRFQDLLIPGWHAPLIVMVFGAATLLLSGRLFQPLFAKIGRVVAFMTVLMLLAVGVSVWPGGAYQYVMDYWIPVLPTFFFLCGFVRTFRQLKTTVVVAACGYSTIAYLALVVPGDSGMGRLGISAFTFGNANDLAMVLLFGLPMSLWAILDRNGNPMVRLYLVGALICTVPVFFRTGSRSGLVALACLAIYTLIRQNFATRLRIIVVAVVVIPIGLSLAPRRVLDRYATLISGFFEPRDPISNPARAGEEEVDEVAVGAAVASATGRWQLFKRSVVVTLENPVLGVGPGMFVVAENEMAIGEGRLRGAWKSSHNMFTQISSEVGLPALCLYLYLIVLTWKILSRAERADRRKIRFAPEMRRMAVALKSSTIIFVVSGLTLSIGYGPFLPLLCGWAIVLERFLASAAWQFRAEMEEEAEQLEAAQEQPVPEAVFARGALPAARS